MTKNTDIDTWSVRGQRFISVLHPLNVVLDDPSLGLSLDDLISKQPVVGIAAEVPGPNADILPLLLQALLQGA